MVVENACNDVKTDLQNGTFNLYTTDFPIYIKDEDSFQGGNVYILLQNGLGDPIQLVNGPVLITPRSCDIIIRATSTTIINNLRDDVEKLLIATSRGYHSFKTRNFPDAKNIFRIKMSVKMTL